MRSHHQRVPGDPISQKPKLINRKEFHWEQETQEEAGSLGSQQTTTSRTKPND